MLSRCGDNDISISISSEVLEVPIDTDFALISDGLDPLEIGPSTEGVIVAIVEGLDVDVLSFCVLSQCIDCIDCDGMEDGMECVGSSECIGCVSSDL